ncbi:bifunctional 4-hydroxy-2-oxoglutarate aldolase/2-dehydro-3-deoxy-phosphogluconate aldolase [Alkalihalobacillus sp. MEB130]|uniref:bifunctional 4-hydroxy-2-oxoglutarate aldolase/2-dehydro-3-deoxy-phosphogluconate aldolase n=1 Tax=Alkalihalobacillus sp. MEB130 TaxID=2976704 RepID=UPI0028DF95DD|nr:bifunctional 4-hydroxy-2-oxoglutarate aldolase/2-dehydro-3-deoxy-phosphogluconate aldolase [Alkalihalobacillus sp. MEB130]MDT8859776.1 bifunctional 4-hydroxy-2-oxoglutarate aldolase/2-dehydro-3-deoxy-phosphogluconate aldolase [Alkalihalobacillus sp. MEB130]
MNLLEQITESGIVAVIRGSKPENIVEIGKALREGGVKALEITVETPRAMSIIEKVAIELENEDVIVGAGTVLDPETARAAILSGARFVFSPTVNVETIKMSKRYGVLSIPGAFTPTEIVTAYEHGADLIKVFPASAVGPSYIKNIKGPLPHVPLMVTGGIGLANAADYIKAGAVGLGVGGTLVPATINEEALLSITDKAREFVRIVKQTRE